MEKISFVYADGQEDINKGTENTLNKIIDWINEYEKEQSREGDWKKLGGDEGKVKGGGE